MDVIRRTLGASLAVLGLYYCCVSALTLVQLTAATDRLIANSGDPDFRLDYPHFLVAIALGSLAVAVFGYHSIVKGYSAVQGQRPSWLPLAVLAPVLHWFWFMYRVIGNGRLPRDSQVAAQRDNLVWFGAICLTYVVTWWLSAPRNRRLTQPDPPALTTTTARG